MFKIFMREDPSAPFSLPNLPLDWEGSSPPPPVVPIRVEKLGRFCDMAPGGGGEGRRELL